MANLFEKQFSKFARAAAAVADYLDGATVDLYKEAVPKVESTTAANLTAVIANYTGYAQGEITWQEPSISDLGVVEVVGTCPVFRPTGTTVGNVIVGCFIRKATTGELLFFGELDGEPIHMEQTTHSIMLIIRLRVDRDSVTVVVS